MKTVRLVARLDVKGGQLIKGIRFEGLRVLGSPSERAVEYYRQGADEILYIDQVASLYDRLSITELVTDVTREVFVPITVGGGIRNLEDAKAVLRAGADKVAVNSAAVRNPALIGEIAEHYGSQCFVLSVEAKSRGKNSWEVFTDAGREKTGIDVLEWVDKAVALGAGEVLVTSIDQDGTRSGPDVSLLAAISRISTVPVIGSGGIATVEHARGAFEEALVEGVAVGAALHYGNLSLQYLRDELLQAGIGLREYVD